MAIIAADCDGAAIDWHSDTSGAVLRAEAAQLGARRGGEDIDAAGRCDEDGPATEMGYAGWLAGRLLCGASHGGGGGVDRADSVVPADRVHVGGA